MLFSALMFGRQRPWWASFRWDQPKAWPCFISIASDFEWNVGFILMASQKASEISTMCCCAHGRARRDKTGEAISKLEQQHGMQRRTFIQVGVYLTNLTTLIILIKFRINICKITTICCTLFANSLVLYDLYFCIQWRETAGTFFKPLRTFPDGSELLIWTTLMLHFWCLHHQTTICTGCRNVLILEGDVNPLKAKFTYLVPTYLRKCIASSSRASPARSSG